MSEHAIANAKAWLTSIVEMTGRLNAAQAAKEYATQEEVAEEIQNSVLSVRVRDGWRGPGSPSDGAEEFEVLLSTGGPALRIHGYLTEYGEADGYELQWQDWGTPWTRLPTSREEGEAIGAFLGCFYFGDC